MTRKKFAIIVLGLVLLASLLACGYFGVKTLRRSHQRRVAMATYEKKDYVLAERLLLAYVSLDQNSEPEFVALANIYREFGDYGMEAQMWNMASSLNPLNAEYSENVLKSAKNAANYNLIHDLLERKAKLAGSLTDEEVSLNLIACVRSGRSKDAKALYQQYTKNDPDFFKMNELGRMGEFLLKEEDLSLGARMDYLNAAEKSGDPLVKYESLYSQVLEDANRPQDKDMDEEEKAERDAETEKLLHRLVAANFYAGTPILADFYYSRSRFADVINVAVPYLRKIDDMNLYLLCLESCVYEKQLEPLRELVKRLHRRPGSLPFLGDYGEVLVAYLEDAPAKLADTVRQYGKYVSSPLSRYIRLISAIRGGNFSEIRTAASDYFSKPPVLELYEPSVRACLDYIKGEIEKQDVWDDLSQMAELAQLVSAYYVNDENLSVIILFDRYRKGLVNEAELVAAQKAFPENVLLQRILAEYLIFNGRAEEAIGIIEILLKAGEETPDNGIEFLYMLALEQLGQYDEAEKVFIKLVERSEFDLELLYQYFFFCTQHNRVAELNSMADKLETVKDGRLEHYAKFFRAAAIYEKGRDAETDTVDEDAVKSALTILKDTPNDDANFTMYAANQLSRHDWLDDAEAKYNALLKKDIDPTLILVNLSELYQAKGDQKKALESASDAYSIEKQSMLPAFVYAKRLSEAGRYEEAVNVFNFPSRAVNYREDVVELWTECMKKTIEKNIADRKYTQAEENCKHLLVIVPGDEFGQAKLDEVYEILHPKKDQEKEEAAEAEPAAS